MKTTETLVYEILSFLSDVAELLPRPLETPYAHIRRLRRLSYKDYYDCIHNLKKRGVVSVRKKGDKLFVRLTDKGSLEILFAKASIAPDLVWDKKWRVVIFDIPESAREQRDKLRRLLRLNKYYKLQASVFISPYPLNVSAITYLKTTGLLKYIRILRVDRMDTDSDLRKRFGLPTSDFHGRENH
jgi:CRISPR-associated endonuclease Cas2